MTKEQEHFIKEMLEHGDKTRAYIAAYHGINPKYACGSAYRLLKRPHIQDALKDLDTHALKKAEQDTGFKFILFTYAEKRDLLRRIALGETLVIKRQMKNGEWKTKELIPSFADRLRAIDIDNRMAGEYAPDKLQVEQYSSGIIEITGDGWEAAA